MVPAWNYPPAEHSREGCPMKVIPQAGIPQMVLQGTLTPGGCTFRVPQVTCVQQELWQWYIRVSYFWRNPRRNVAGGPDSFSLDYQKQPPLPPSFPRPYRLLSYNCLDFPTWWVTMRSGAAATSASSSHPVV